MGRTPSPGRAGTWPKQRISVAALHPQSRGLIPPMPSKSAPYRPAGRVAGAVRIENVCDHGTMSSMAAEQRRAVIQRMLAEDPSATQQQLAGQLGVDQRTVSRDLDKLREAGVIGMPKSSGRGRPRGSVVELQVDSGSAPSTGAGEELVAKIRAELDAKGLEPDAREEGLLIQIAQVADDIAELRGIVDAEGQTFPPATKGGVPRLHPAVAEIRQSRAVLARLLSQISLEESTKSPVKQKAANTRWRAHQLARARQAEGG